MKQYTDKDQTAQLIELGFPKPKSVINEYKVLELNPYAPIEFEYSYSIGELIEFLPEEITDEYDETTWLEFNKAEVYYTNFGTMFYYKNSVELIDALFNMCVTLTEKGVI